jgi:hypothetical protein
MINAVIIPAVLLIILTGPYWVKALAHLIPQIG